MPRIDDHASTPTVRDEPIVIPTPPSPTSRERIDSWLRIDLVDDPFAVDWAPPQR
jgi:hypothetical protein